MATNVKVFKFTRRRTVEIEPLLENGANVIDVDESRFNLKDFKLQEGSGDSLAYSATLCYKKKPLCKCLNVGNGEETSLKELDIMCGAVMTSITLRLKEVKYSYAGMEFQLTIGKIADFIAETLRNQITDIYIKKATLAKLNNC